MMRDIYMKVLVVGIMDEGRGIEGFIEEMKRVIMGRNK